MPPSRPKPGVSAGFSLLEVLIALAIVGLILGATVTVFGNGLRGHDIAADADTALTLAEAKLDAAGITDKLAPSHAEGVFAGRFRWRLVIAPYDDTAPDDKDATAADRPASAFRLFRVAVTIAWRDGVRSRQVALTTLRLAPVPP